MSAVNSLRASLGELVFLPGDEGYDRARTPWNLAVDQRPAAVATPSSAAEVVQVVRFAAAAGLKVVPSATGWTRQGCSSPTTTWVDARPCRR